VSFAGVLTWNLAMERVSASLLAYFIFLQPLLGVLFGVFLLREALNWGSLFGGILILLGVYCATLKPQGERSLILK
jgi:drug/metabolite transporter (DMT)-like permease